MNRNVFKRNQAEFEKYSQEIELAPQNLAKACLKNLKRLDSSTDPAAVLTAISAQIRQMDNHAGLVAHHNHPLAKCRAARFRTRKFMEIEEADRSGATADRDQPYSIHIEHTIPVAVRRAILLRYWDAGKSMDVPDLLAHLGRFRVGVAMARCEASTAVKPRCHRTHPYADELISLDSRADHIPPFSRYEEEVEIWDMQEGKELDKSISLRNLRLPLPSAFR